ncbi:hypothetical protein RW03080701_018 [Synechococcus phage S-RIM8]|uniref:Uncharacterized protein n=2 Tax=Neptunevirus srim18 TaxID=2734121 RepID=A0A1D7S958_9CAUD|nr:hypothetical protein SXDG_00109 [Synechococcus phage S-RIM8 A.HR1]YP_009782930.1 hypothetical protein HOQ82_gp224 [Synechococcus phage S-RIM8]AFB15302.1 hypothetical protein SWSG_00059 [Synechococcus phage S-RIM8 A.HR5]AFB17729.1 hypothetical protein SXEG_00147 [Synechococcus phage S-RIM8 A.HR3]AGH57807.1 hypothetical protein CPJG_00055 [Synechococcus phage KBS-M-1A]AFB17518.1 hypothetical protein SXDG_00109 [Synechococcus phage S-RIM8 A.HR1]AOO10170.1 hypothetical protein RW01021201_018 [
MSYQSVRNQLLTADEWNELDALRRAINELPAAVHPDKMEKFTELLIRSQHGVAWRDGSPMSE